MIEVVDANEGRMPLAVTDLAHQTIVRLSRSTITKITSRWSVTMIRAATPTVVLTPMIAMTMLIFSRVQSICFSGKKASFSVVHHAGFMCKQMAKDFIGTNRSYAGSNKGNKPVVFRLKGSKEIRNKFLRR